MVFHLMRRLVPQTFSRAGFRVVCFCLVGAFAFSMVGSVAIAAEPREDKTFFNGKDLTGFSAANMKYFSVKNGAIVGGSKEAIKGNQFLWSKVPVSDFYFLFMVKQTPFKANGGVQFRSQAKGAAAVGYQADVGGGFWGDLYEEHARRLMSSGTPFAKFVKKEQWNRYEILAVGHRVWLAINNQIVCALEDPKGASKGFIGFQIHGGGPQQVEYKPVTLIHNPKVEIAGLKEAALVKLLKPFKGTIKRKKKKKDKKSKEKRPKKVEPKKSGFQVAPGFLPAKCLSANSLLTKRFSVVASSSKKKKPKKSKEPVDGKYRPKWGRASTNIQAQTFPRVFIKQLAQPKTPIAGFSKRFTLADGETIAYLGGSELLTQADNAYLETLLRLHHAGKNVQFRNMAFRGDTLFAQFRPLSFYEGVKLDQRPQTSVTTILAQFGKSESLNQSFDIDEFEKRYGQLIVSLQKYSKRIVLISPTPFEAIYSGDRGTLQRNQRLEKYVNVVQKLAKKHGCLFVDVYRPLLKKSKAVSMTEDGFNLTLAGHWEFSTEVAKQLGATVSHQVELKMGRFATGNIEKLRQAVLAKNRLWLQFWCPENWAFYAGDRTVNPASHIWNGKGKRWFQGEVNSVLPLVAKAEKQVSELFRSVQ